MARPEPGTIEVAYALPARQRVVELAFATGMTAGDAVQRSGLVEEFPELAGRGLDLGIHGRVVPAGQALRPGDRVEILRPLLVDPRESRRRLAAAAADVPRRAGKRR